MTSVNAENAKTQFRAAIRQVALDKVVDLNALLRCQECGGSGNYSVPGQYKPCNHCDGTGLNPSHGSLNDFLPPGTNYMKLSDVLAIIRETK